MTKKTAKLIIWGREFCLPIEYSASIELKELVKVELSVKEFMDNSAEIILKSQFSVVSYAKKFAASVGRTTSDDLFDYITPHMLLVNSADGSIYIALLCGFEYDPEHDIAIIYRDQKLVEVGSQDLVSWW